MGSACIFVEKYTKVLTRLRILSLMHKFSIVDILCNFSTSINNNTFETSYTQVFITAGLGVKCSSPS